MAGCLKNWCMLLFFVISFVSLSSASTLNLRVDGSQELKGVNFTLMKTSVNDTKAVLCVNNNKVIVSERRDTFQNIIIKAVDVFSRSASFDVDVACQGSCICASDCANSACFSKVGCVSDSDCDDLNLSTSDFCVSGSCNNIPSALKACVSDLECNDNNPCTSDDCNSVIKKCVYEDIEECSIQPLIPISPEIPEEPAVQTLSLSSVQILTVVLVVFVVLLFLALIIKKVSTKGL